MKKECEIVQDLLFGYNDGVISKSSTELVENHLKECDICKNKLEEIQKDSKDDNKEKADSLKTGIEPIINGQSHIFFISASFSHL